MKKLMLAGLDQTLVDQLYTNLEERYVLHYCNCGAEVLSEFTTFLPELLVVDLTMPDCDTVGILQAVQARGGQTQALVIAYAYHEQLCAQLYMVDTVFLLIRPFTAVTITERLLQMEQLLPTAPTRSRADEILRDLGLDSHSAGFSCLRSAIDYKLHHPDCLYTGELCVYVAKQSGGTASSVDKAMSRCIHKATRRMDPVLWAIYMGDITERISCAQFIQAIVNYIKK